MEEVNNSIELESIFCFPSIENELGEIERVASVFGVEDVYLFKQQFLEKAKNTNLSQLPEEDWRKLENTDSFGVDLGGWGKIEEHVSHTNKITGADRSWQTLKSKMENGEELDAPIILKHNSKLHLVAGNTRLMVARALGVKPQVLIVEI